MLSLENLTNVSPARVVVFKLEGMVSVAEACIQQHERHERREVLVRGVLAFKHKGDRFCCGPEAITSCAVQHFVNQLKQA